MSNALQDIAAERKRQITVEEWTPDHDDEHDDGELAKVAACYANPMAILIDGHGVELGKPNTGALPIGWPESCPVGWWKPSTRRRDLVKAAALIVAEIERLDRAALADQKVGEA